jgi:hypothetical protein
MTSSLHMRRSYLVSVLPRNTTVDSLQLFRHHPNLYSNSIFCLHRPLHPHSPHLAVQYYSQSKGREARPTPAKKARVAKYQNYVPEEETIRNDYNQRYVDGGEWPQNWVQGADPARRFEE